MSSDLLLDAIGITGVAVILIFAYFTHKKSKPHIAYEEETIKYNNSPIIYSFFMFSVCFLTASIFIDFLSTLTVDYKGNILLKYVIPLFAALSSFFRFKHIQKNKNKRNRNALTISSR